MPTSSQMRHRHTAVGAASLTVEYRRMAFRAAKGDTSRLRARNLFALTTVSAAERAGTQLFSFLRVPAQRV
jgi:hypothetical protein